MGRFEHTIARHVIRYTRIEGCAGRNQYQYDHEETSTIRNSSSHPAIVCKVSPNTLCEAESIEETRDAFHEFENALEKGLRFSLVSVMPVPFARLVIPSLSAAMTLVMTVRRAGLTLTTIVQMIGLRFLTQINDIPEYDRTYCVP